MLVALALALLTVLIACGGGLLPARGSLAGTVVVGDESTGRVLHALPAGASVRSASEAPAGAVAEAASLGESTLDFVPGEVIVGFRPVAGSFDVAGFEAVSSLEAAGVGLSLVRSTPVLASGLYRVPGLSRDDTLAVVRELRARPDVAYAEPNYLYQALAAPNDPLYGRQWHYDAIDMEGAWDITTGSASVVVAVLDSGILFSSADASKRHPDFAGRTVPGYDFISDLEIAVDGDGRDPDPFDAVEFESYHGSHVAGTIGAASDNGVGVTGVDWQAKLLPVRVLGEGGGTLADIRDGLLWAAGFGVAGVPVNANPADVVNMSLGGAGACSAVWQAALDFVAEDVIVVVAAGNSNVNASNFSPAGCAGVITVGATDVAGERSWFSNYGSRIDVMAPGGDTDADLNLDSFPDGVFSVGFNDMTDSFTYTYLQGTSMAAPHVAGIVALMKAIEPNLDTGSALAALRASATPLSDQACDGFGASRDLTSSDCGAGLIDAFKALSYIEAGEIPDPVGAQLRFTPPALEYGATTLRIDYQLTNIGDDPLTWELIGYVEAGDNPGAMLSGAFVIPDDSPFEGALAVDESVTTAIVIDRALLGADGNYQIHLVFELGDGSEELLLMRFTKTTSITPTLSGPMIVAAYVEDAFGELIESGSQSSAGAIHDFDFDVTPGQNLLAAWSDKNDNGFVDDGDLFGYYPTALSVAPAQRVAGLTLRVDPIFSNSPDEAGLIRALERAAREAASTR